MSLTAPEIESLRRSLKGRLRKPLLKILTGDDPKDEKTRVEHRFLSTYWKGRVPGPRNVHTEHCCVRHGCKYVDKDCPIATDRETQSHLCERCDYDVMEVLFLSRRTKRAKAWAESVVRMDYVEIDGVRVRLGSMDPLDKVDRLEGLRKFAEAAFMAGRLSTASYGQEDPDVPGSDEDDEDDDNE